MKQATVTAGRARWARLNERLARGATKENKVTASKVGRGLAALALALFVGACDDNPLAEDRDEAAYFRLTASNIAVNAGDEVMVHAVIVNRFGAATHAPVTGTPCDSKITAEPDSL